jgi:3'-phosphoadenosine 5'-phosphosulfate sulfotransferase (PAPS reductase)/FAD synthetase
VINIERSYASLINMQSLPYEIKLKKAEQLILYMLSNHEMFVSKSGIDSIVLDHMVQKVADRIGVKVKSVFIDTGLEEKSVVEYARKYTDVIIRPEMKFKEVLTKYGYPIISKEQSRYIENIRNDNISDKTKKRLLSKNGESHYRLADRWRYLIDSDFKISSKCCYYLKKRPSAKYSKETGVYPFIGIMTEESKTRRDSWVNHGCNIEGSKVKSRPLMIFKKQDVFRYVYENDVPIPSVYGDIVLEDGFYKTTGVDNTGCIYCGFGKHKENGKYNDFIRLKNDDYNRYNYVLNGGEYVDGVWTPSDDGLGLGHVLDVYGVNYNYDDYYNVKYNEKLHNKFKAISPTGKIYYHFDIHAFAYYFGLDPYDIGHVLDNTYNNTKDWSFEYVDEFTGDWTVDNCNDKVYELSKKYKVSNNYNWFIARKDDGIYYSNNQREFARQFKLSKQCIYKCLHNKQKQHKGFKFEFVDSIPDDLSFNENENIFKYNTDKNT